MCSMGLNAHSHEMFCFQHNGMPFEGFNFKTAIKEKGCAILINFQYKSFHSPSYSHLKSISLALKCEGGIETEK